VDFFKIERKRDCILIIIITGTDPEELQEEFGKMYITHCLGSCHGKIMQTVGRTLYDFFSNIDAVHSYVKLIYTDAKIPAFQTKRVAEYSMTVRYFTDRYDIECIIPGMIQQVAKSLFQLDVITTRKDMPYQTIKVYTMCKDSVHRMFPKDIDVPRSLILKADVPKVSPHDFAKVFPFHIIFDKSMFFLEVGTVLHRHLKMDNNFREQKVTSYLNITRPIDVDFDFESISDRLESTYILTQVERDDDCSTDSDICRFSQLGLIGQMVNLPGKDAILFMCSPNVTSVKDMHKKGVQYCDIPKHDATRSFLFLSENVQKEKELTHQLSIVGDRLKEIHTNLEDELILYNRLLYAVLPPAVADIIGDGKQIPPERFKDVTLMFSGIVDFSMLCQLNESTVIASMLNELFIRFDALVQKMNEDCPYVYKVKHI